MVVDAGSCTWDGDNEQLLATGSVTNSGNQDAEPEVEVTWSDSSGELDSWSDTVPVGAGATEAWDMSTDWADPPAGLSCSVAIIG